MNYKVPAYFWFKFQTIGGVGNSNLKYVFEFRCNCRIANHMAIWSQILQMYVMESGQPNNMQKGLHLGNLHINFHHRY